MSTPTKKSRKEICETINISLFTLSRGLKRNNFNSDEVFATDINQRLLEFASGVNEAFSQFELHGDEVTPATVREELKRILNEEKSTRLMVAQVY